MGTIYWKWADLEASVKCFRRAREILKLTPEGRHWLVLYNLSRVYLDQRKLDEAMPLAGASLRAAKETEDDFGISMSLSMMARYHWLSGNLPAAIASSYEALITRVNCGFSYWLMNAIQFHGFLLADSREPEAATVLLAATRASLPQDREFDQREYAIAKDKAKGAMNNRLFQSAWAKGLAMSADEAFQYAISFR